MSQAQAPEFVVSIEEETPIEVQDSIKLVGVRAGTSKNKGTFYEFKAYYAPQRSHGGAIALVEQGYNKDHDPPWYTKIVTLRDTGEVIHDGSEPLAQHRHDRKGR